MKIKLCNKFYKKEAISESIKNFEEVCECEILNDDFEIEIIPKIDDEARLKGEFCNFVLGVTKDNMLF